MLLQGERKRVILTLVVTGAFVAMLAGTSKARDDEEPKPAEAEKAAPEAEAKTEGKTDAKKVIEHELTVPSTEGWKEVKLPSAGLVVSIPPDASIDPAAAGNDAAFTGRYFRVKLGSGLEAYFAQNSGQPVDFAEQKRWYENDAIGFEGYVFEAADALVVARKDDPITAANKPAGESGEYWETTACSAPIGDKPLCAQSVGASIEEGKMLKATHEECFAVVAIARSIREAK